MLGLASMLYRCGMVDEAMLVTILALDKSPDVVAIHFMLANLYAAKVCSEVTLLVSVIIHFISLTVDACSFETMSKFLFISHIMFFSDYYYKFSL